MKGVLKSIFRFVRGKCTQPTPPRTLYFKDELSAFEYACAYQNFSLIRDEFLPCLIETVSKPLDGYAKAIIRIPYEGGEIRTVASFLSSGSHNQLEGKLCVIVVGDFIEAMGIPALMVVAELSPELDLSKNCWKIKRRL